MVSKVYELCNRYESGYGHGLQNDGLDLSKTPHGDPEMGEAYQIGYNEGLKARDRFVDHVEKTKRLVEALRQIVSGNPTASGRQGHLRHMKRIARAALAQYDKTEAT